MLSVSKNLQKAVTERIDPNKRLIPHPCFIIPGLKTEGKGAENPPQLDIFLNLLYVGYAILTVVLDYPPGCEEEEEKEEEEEEEGNNALRAHY